MENWKRQNKIVTTKFYKYVVYFTAFWKTLPTCKSLPSASQIGLRNQYSKIILISL